MTPGRIFKADALIDVATTKAEHPLPLSDTSYLSAAAIPSQPRFPYEQQHGSEEGNEAEHWDCKGSETAPEPQLERRYIIACPPLEDSEGTSLCSDECDPSTVRTATDTPSKWSRRLAKVQYQR